MKKIVSLLFILCSVVAYTQEYNLTIISEFQLIAEEFIGVDDYNAIYFTIENQLIKKGRDGEFQFSALQLGTISSVDILNPLRITVFYESSNTVVILDNTLSEIKRINFSIIDNFRNISHASTANDHNLWIFNTDNQQLELYDWRSKKIVTQFPPRVSNPLEITSNFNFAWVLDEQKITTYNVYGSLIKEETIIDIESIKQSHGDLIAKSKNSLFYKKKNETQFSRISLTDLPVEQLYLNNQILYIYNRQKATTFKIISAK